MKKIFAIVFIVIAVLSVVFGVVAMTKTQKSYSTLWVYKETYGGDAYTGIQNAAASTANAVVGVQHSVHDMQNAMSFGFGAILIIAGLVIGTIGVSKLVKKEEGSDVKKAAVPEKTFTPQA